MEGESVQGELRVQLLREAGIALDSECANESYSTWSEFWGCPWRMSIQAATGNSLPQLSCPSQSHMIYQRHHATLV